MARVIVLDFVLLFSNDFFKDSNDSLLEWLWTGSNFNSGYVTNDHH